MSKSRPANTPVPNRFTVTVRSDLLPDVFKAAKTINSNPNAFVNGCIEGCLTEMRRPAAAEPRVPEIVAQYRSKVGVLVGSEQSNDAGENPLVMRMANLIALMTEEMDAVRAGKSTRNPMAIAAIDAGFAEETRLLKEMNERWHAERQEMHGAGEERRKK